MDGGLPVEVIGDILSRLESARDVSLASATSRKWREAGCCHLHSLSFHRSDWHGYERMSKEAWEVVITRTVLRTTSLRRLTICFEKDFTPSPIVAWLMHTRNTLRFLTFIAQTDLHMQVLETCGRDKLEGLVLGNVALSGNGLGGFQTFKALSSLTLSQVKMSAVDLNLLLSACPKLTTLSLTKPCINAVRPEDLELSSDSVQAFYLDGLGSSSSRGPDAVFNFDNLKVLSVKHSFFETFKVVSKGNLRELSLDDVGGYDFDFGQCKHLEAVHVVNCTVDDMWPRLYSMIAGACRLRRLKLWGLQLSDMDEYEALNLGEVAVYSPLLHEVSLGFDYLCGLDLKTVAGSSVGFDRVCSLEFSSFIHVPFASWLQELVERCPNLERLIVRSEFSSRLSGSNKRPVYYQMIGDFHAAILGLMRKLPQVAVEFHYT